MVFEIGGRLPMHEAATSARLRGANTAGGKLRGWPQIPTPIIVAVLGVVLGSWLLPAFTRQWDDRQKAGDLKASLVTEMASVTGRALMSAREASVSPVAERALEGAMPAAGKDWSLADLQVRARLQAYFGPGAVDHWTLVSQYVTSTLSVAYRNADGDIAVVPSQWISKRTSPGLARLYRDYYYDENTIEPLEKAILAEEETLTRSLLAMRVRGYSTTWRDFVSDLFGLR
jgi:hypothetical protein